MNGNVSTDMFRSTMTIDCPVIKYFYLCAFDFPNVKASVSDTGLASGTLVSVIKKNILIRVDLKFKT